MCLCVEGLVYMWICICSAEELSTRDGFFCESLVWQAVQLFPLPPSQKTIAPLLNIDRLPLPLSHSVPPLSNTQNTLSYLQDILQFFPTFPIFPCNFHFDPKTWNWHGVWYMTSSSPGTMTLVNHLLTYTLLYFTMCGSVLSLLTLGCTWGVSLGLYTAAVKQFLWIKRDGWWVLMVFLLSGLPPIWGLLLTSVRQLAAVSSLICLQDNLCRFLTGFNIYVSSSRVLFAHVFVPQAGSACGLEPEVHDSVDAEELITLVDVVF